jgi:thiamine-phosphate pyrophosphorylase
MAVVPTAEATLHASRAGATIVQLRSRQVPVSELEAEAELAVTICEVPVLISSRMDVALSSGAAGVNLREDDPPVSAARGLLGSGALVGRSVHSAAGAVQAQIDGADYVLFGPVFASRSHPGAGGQGLEALRVVAAAVGIPVLAIGGVERRRVPECLAAGATGYASIGVFEAGWR